MLSRVANSLYWTSRYLERAEHTARLLSVNLVLMLDQAPGFARPRWEQLVSSLRMSADMSQETSQIAAAITFDRDHPNSIRSTITSARDNARQVREQLSSEMWEQMNRLYLHIGTPESQELWKNEPHTFLRSVTEGIHLFQGISEATLSQGEGWHWIQLGRFVERTTATAAFLEANFGPYVESQNHPEQVGEYLDWVSLLKSCTAFEAYCQVYTADLQPRRIAEFLLLNRDFPRSVRFSSVVMQNSLRSIARATRTRKANQIDRLAGKLHAALDYAQIDEIMEDGLIAYLRNIQRQCGQVHATLERTYFAPPLEAILGE